MRNSLLFALLLLSCGQDYNSNTFDDTRYSNNITVTSAADERFVSAYNLIQDKCTSCHLGYHNDYAGYTSSQVWVNNNLVVSGDFTNSPLKGVLKNYGGDMPLQGTKFSDSEILVLENWINNL